MVGMHIPPHHLRKLMCVSKSMYRTVDTNAYWTRVASHLFWRSCQYRQYVSKDGDDGMGAFLEWVDWSPENEWPDYPWGLRPSCLGDAQAGLFAMHRAAIAARHMTATESSLSSLPLL
jgi:hypothetical protein